VKYEAVHRALRTPAVAYRGDAMKTTNLINVLMQDASARWRVSNSLATAFAVGAVIAFAIFVFGVGVRPDISVASHTVRVQFKFLFAVTLLSGAAGAVAQVGRPDATPDRWAFVLTLVPLLIGLAVFAEMFATPAQSWMTRLIGEHSVYCLTTIPTLALAPLACLLFVLRESAPARPGLAGAVAGLAASGIAVFLYALHCPDDSPLFVAVWYSFAIAVVVAVGYLTGLRLLKW
jgi:hypothetical protein